MLLLELYQEGDDDSFTFDEKDYNINKIFQATEDAETIQIKVDDLKWILKYDDADPKRVKEADLDAPILVTKWRKKWAAVDGLHRLTKAVEDGVDALPAKVVTKAMLKDALIKDKA